jgi:vancomycin resistance protein VanJ
MLGSVRAESADQSTRPSGRPSHDGRAVNLVRAAAIGWIAFVLALLAIHIFVPQRSGFLALTEVLEPYIVLVTLFVAPFEVIRPRQTGALIVAALVVVTLGRYLLGWVSLPAAGPATLNVVAWNIEWGPGGADRVVEGLSNVDADLVALEELQPNMAARIDDDPGIQAAYPERALGPDPTINGVGLLSRYPILEQSVSHDPPFLRAVVAAPGAADRLVVFVVHPIRGAFDELGALPIGIDTSVRDEAIRQIRAAVAVDIAAGKRVLVMGDINTTEREPAYAELAAGLHDAQLDAGIGPGFTWRPDSLTGLPFGLLRIDYVFSTPDLRAVAYSTRCTRLSDHCIVQVGLRLVS